MVVHCGTSTFPGALNQFGDPILLDDVLRDFRSLDVVLAHGGRGWWYDAAAFLALSNDARVDRAVRPAAVPAADLLRAAQLDPAHPADDLRHGLAGHPRHRRQRPRGRHAVPDEETAELVLAGNAARVYNLLIPETVARPPHTR